MKRVYFLIVFLLLIIGLPTMAFAQKIDLSTYNTLNLEETLKAESITPKLENYTSDSNKVPIYLFRRDGCTFCKKFLNYINDTLVNKYGNMFEIISFEVVSDAKNSALLDEVAEFLGDDPNSDNFGVPYIVIGDQTFIGYAESMNSSIESALTSLY